MAHLANVADYQTALYQVIYAQETAYGYDPEMWVRFAGMNAQDMQTIVNAYNAWKKANIGPRINNYQSTNIVTTAH